MTKKQRIMLIPALGGLACSVISFIEGQILIGFLSLLSVIVPVIVWWDDHIESQKQQKAFIMLKDKVENLGVDVIENPEWIYVIVDAEEKVLFGIKRHDGSVYWGAGIPDPIKKELDLLGDKVKILESIIYTK